MSVTQVAGSQISPLSGDVSGSGSAVSVDKIKGTPVSATAPTSGQVLAYNGSNWIPTTSGSGGGYATYVVAAPTGVAATDTAAIQAGLTALLSTGGTVVLREGTYKLNATLTASTTKVTAIIGQGIDVTIIQADTTLAASGMISISGTGGLTLQDITFDGNFASRGTNASTVEVLVLSTGPCNLNRFKATNMTSGASATGAVTLKGTPFNVVDSVFLGNGAACEEMLSFAASTTAPGHVKGCVFNISNASIFAAVVAQFGIIQGNTFICSVTGTLANQLYLNSICSAIGNRFVVVSGTCTTAINAPSSAAKSSITGNHASTTTTGQITAGISTIEVVGNSGFSAYSGGNQVANDSNTFNAVVVSATAPTTGQVLTATSTTAANWATPSAGGYSATVVVAAASGVAATDTTNVTTAITAASTAGGGIVLLREGTYLINSTLTLPTKVSLVGQGRNATVLQAQAAVGATAFIAMPNAEAGLRHLTIDCNGTARGGNAVSDITVSGDGVFMESVRFTGPNGTGAGLTANIANTVAVTGEAMICTNCEFNFNSKRASFYFAVRNGSFIGCAFNISVISFTLMTDGVAGSNVIIEGCRIVMSTASGTSSLFQTNFASQWTLSGNNFYVVSGAAGTGVCIDMNQAGNRATVVGNISNSTLIGTLGGSATTTIACNYGFLGYLGAAGTAPNSTRVANDTQTLASVVVSNTAPTTGQVLTATSTTAAAWSAAPGYAATVVVGAATGTAATDTAAINAAMTTATSTGGTVLLREGTYAINGTLVLPSKVFLRGQGADATFLKADAGLGANPIVSSSFSNHVGLSHLTVDMNFSVRGSVASSDLSFASNAINARMDWVKFTNSSCSVAQSAVVVSGPGTIIDNCEFVANGALSLNALSATSVVVSNCLFSASVAVGNILTGGGSMSICNNQFSTSVGLTSYISIQSGIMTAIHGNTFSQTAGTTTIAINIVTSSMRGTIVGNGASTLAGSITTASATVSMTGNAGFTAYTGGTQAGNV